MPEFLQNIVKFHCGHGQIFLRKSAKQVETGKLKASLKFIVLLPLKKLGKREEE